MSLLWSSVHKLYFFYKYAASLRLFSCGEIYGKWQFENAGKDELQRSEIFIAMKEFDTGAPEERHFNGVRVFAEEGDVGFKQAI